jgi:hypothetical protein
MITPPNQELSRDSVLGSFDKHRSWCLRFPESRHMFQFFVPRGPTPGTV